MFTKLIKFPVYWSFKISTNYKRNAITSELHRTKKIATDFDKELRRIKTKCLHAGYPVKFISDISFRFSEEKEELLIPKWLFDETKLVVIRLTFARRREKFSKRFISKLQILPMTKSDSTLFGILTRYSPFSIIKIRYNI